MRRTTNNTRSRGLAQWLAQVDAAMRSGSTFEAARIACNAISMGYSHAALYILRAFSKRREGRIEEALADLQRARDLNPRSLWALNDMADCLNALGRCAEALATADAAIAMDGKQAKTWFHKGQAHQALRDLVHARAALERAVALDPGFAEAHARLANLAAEQASPAAARKHALAALALTPGDAMATLALIAADIAEDQVGDAERLIGAFLARAEIPPPLRAIAIAQLGDLRDAQGRIAEAFAAYAESRSVWTGFHVPRWAAEGREFGCDQIARLGSGLDQQPARRGRAP